MSFFEELGAGLGSLSLEGDRNTSGVLHNLEDDDSMDIDSMGGAEIPVDVTMDQGRDSDRRSSTNLNETISDEKHLKETKQEDTESSSLFEMLNPTSLGVKYALKPQKLLMPPPHSMSPIKSENQLYPMKPKAHTEDYDYDFDTSFSTCVEKENHVAINRNRVPSELERFTKEQARWNQDMNFEPQFYANANPLVKPNQIPFHHPNNSGPLQIHHHHYYPKEDSLTLARKGFDQKTPSNLSLSSRESSPQDFLQPPGNSLVAKDNHNHPNPWNYTVHFHSGDVSSPMLPSPWDPRAAPAERKPYVISSYLQLLLNTVLSSYALHIVYVMVQTIKQDVAQKLEQESKNILGEIALCKHKYHENSCDTAVPLLEELCAQWDKCMNQDTVQLGNRSSVSASTIGMILNSLVEPLSFKVFVVVAMAIVVTFACNFVFGYIRAKTYYGWVPANHSQRQREPDR